MHSNFTFTYDGDGSRVKSVLTTNLGSATTYFVGAHYEVTGSEVTKYYYAGTQRIAMRKNGTLTYILSDHLGSTSMITDSSGNVISETKYREASRATQWRVGKAWGETRYSSGTNPTDYTYTGQYSYTSDFGLMFYNARWYDPSLGRFAQADTIVGFDRYQYVNNNPLRYVDPSGHIPCEGANKDDGPQCVYYKNGGPNTFEDFEKLSWQQRKDWVAIFAEKNNLSNWFDDMGSAIDFMISDPSLSPEGSIAEVMDAAVLQAVNDGWLMHKNQDAFGDGGQGWKDFFDALASFKIGNITENQLIAIRLQAEQFGVDYSWNLVEVQSAYSSSSSLDQIYFDIFKGGADSYRSFGTAFRSNPLVVSATELSGNGLLLMGTDPRTSGPILNAVGTFGYPTALFVWGQSRTPLSSYP